MKAPITFTRFLFFALLVFLSVLISACRYNISAETAGNLKVETSITREELQDAINAGIADPLVKNVTVSLQSGYALVSAERQRLNDTSKSDTLSFRLDLGVSDGKLNVRISDAVLDGKPLAQNRVDNWNTTIANRLQLLSQRHKGATLQTVDISSEGVRMTWLVSK